LLFKKNEESQQCYDKIKELNPNDYENAVIWYERGIIFYQLKVYEEAIQCYDKIIEICKKNHDVYIYIQSAIQGECIMKPLTLMIKL
jgi:tetratricopeptide (TPR) repeat protein